MDAQDKKIENQTEQPHIDVTVEAPKTNQSAPADADTSMDNLSTVWDNPLFLPSGSVRSLLALMFAGTAVYSVIVGIDLKEPMMNLLFVIIGFYFGNKLK